MMLPPSVSRFSSPLLLSLSVSPVVLTVCLSASPSLCGVYRRPPRKLSAVPPCVTGAPAKLCSVQEEDQRKMLKVMIAISVEI